MHEFNYMLKRSVCRRCMLRAISVYGNDYTTCCFTDCDLYVRKVGYEQVYEYLVHMDCSQPLVHISGIFADENKLMLESWK